MDTYNEDEKIQLAWMATHYITNKDKEAEVQNFSALQSHRKQEKKNSRRNPAAWNLPLPEQELDLHGFTIEEAIAAIEEMFLAMQLAKMSVLRLIHGYRLDLSPGQDKAQPCSFPDVLSLFFRPT